MKNDWVIMNNNWTMLTNQKFEIQVEVNMQHFLKSNAIFIKI